MKVKHRFRIYPTERQERALAELFGCIRFAFNRALEYRSETFQKTGKGISYNQSSAYLTALKKEPANHFLYKVSCVPLQQSLRHLQTAYTNFFAKRASYPRFKSKRGPQSATFTRNGFVWDQQNHNLSIAKIGRLSVRWSRVIKTEPSSVTITKDAAGRYFVTLTVEESRDPLPENPAQVGIDLGLTTLAVLSTGEKIEPLKPLKARLCQLRRAGRTLSRRLKGSNRRERQRIKVAKIYAHIADTRKDYLDKITTSLVRRFGVISIEDLNVKGMVQNRRMARAISDAGWGEFRKMLDYKCLWHGRELRIADRFFPTSKLCSCGEVKPTLRLSERQWTCGSCGVVHDRDLNAANNILAAGHAVSARGGSVRRTIGSTDFRSSLRSVNQLALEFV